MERSEGSSLVDFAREAMNIYRGWQTLHEAVKEDVSDPELWFDDEEFARWLDVDGHKVLGVLVQDRKTQRHEIPSNEGEGYAKGRMLLFVRAKDIKGVKARQTIRIDGKIYVVESGHEIQGVVRKIELSSVEG